MAIDSNEVPRQLPDNPNLRHLKNQARDLLKAGEAKSLTDAQFKIARLYGFPSWPKLKAHVDALKETGRLKHKIDSNDVDPVNKDERIREERFRKIRMYELLKQDAELKLEALREAHGTTLTQVQEAKLREELSRSAREIEEELRRPGNKVMSTSEFQEQEFQEFDAKLLAHKLGIKAGREDELAKLPRIPIQQAIQIASAQQPGMVLECRLVGRVVEDLWLAFYDVRIVSVEGAERTFIHFAISAIDGRILGRINKSISAETSANK